MKKFIMRKLKEIIEICKKDNYFWKIVSTDIM